MAAVGLVAFDPRLAWPLAGFMALLFAVPLGLLLVISLQQHGGYGIGQYAKFLGDPFSLRVLGATLRLGCMPAPRPGRAAQSFWQRCCRC
jgi:putative spermidine/putrescine transport system permease protein